MNLALRALLRSLFFVPLLPFLTGCGICIMGVGDCPSSPNPASSTVISAKAYPAGVYGPWTNAAISGSALSGYSCGFYQDGCKLAFNSRTDAQGNYTLTTAAIPATWQIAIAADSTCSNGAAWGGLLSPGPGPTIFCGDGVSAASAYATPSGCTVTTTIYMDGGGTEVDSDCPGSVTLTATQVGLPTSYPLSVYAYNETGQQLNSGSNWASNSNTVSVTVPAPAETSVITVVDPNNDVVLGAALFTVTQRTRRVKCSPFCT